MIIHCDQFNFISEMQNGFNKCKSIIVIHHINESKDRNLMIISIDTEKAFDKTQYHLIIKAPKKFIIEYTST